MKDSHFRVWLNRMWLEHKDDVLEHTGVEVNYDLRDYFLKYRWWLKAIYKRENK